MSLGRNMYDCTYNCSRTMYSAAGTVRASQWGCGVFLFLDRVTVFIFHDFKLHIIELQYLHVCPDQRTIS